MSEGKQLFVQIAWKGQTAEALKLYENDMKANGWSIENRLSTAAMSMISASKGGRHTTVTVTNDEGETVVIQIVIVEDE